MAQVLVRDLEAATLRRLKMRARQAKRSLQAELKAILEEAVEFDLPRFIAAAAKIRRSLEGRKYRDSGEMQAEDRRR